MQSESNEGSGASLRHGNRDRGDSHEHGNFTYLSDNREYLKASSHRKTYNAQEQGGHLIRTTYTSARPSQILG